MSEIKHAQHDEIEEMREPTILDQAAIKALALSTLEDDEIKALSSEAYKRADERHVSHLPILASLLLTAMQEKGIDCSSCLITTPLENA